MREIKFKAKDINGNWVYGDLLNISNGSIIYHGSDDSSDIKELPNNIAVGLYNNEISVVNRKTIVHSSGLYDRNNKEIYEGDILLFRNTAKVIVKFKHGMFCYVDPFFGEYVGFGANNNFTFKQKDMDSNFEIIGNIYDSKEILNTDEAMKQLNGKKDE